MARNKKIQTTKLVQALEFLSLIGRVIDDRGQHCMFESHLATAFNSIIAAGTTIEEDLNACPHASLLLAALERSGEHYTITQLSPDKLVVRTDDFEAFVPCMDRSLLSWPTPDAPIAVIDDRLIEALHKVAPLLSATGETVLERSILLQAGSCIATDRSVIAEAWHGLDLPCGLLLPKQIVTAIRKAKKPLKAFGCSDITATFYFEDDTWLRTQLFQDRWPRTVTEYLNCTVSPHKVPPLLFESAKQVAPFSSGRVFIKQDLISSHPFDAVEEGSSLKLQIGSDHKERSYHIDNLEFASKFAEWWDEDARHDATYFRGRDVRGLISHVIPHQELASDRIAREDEDIPF